MMKYYLMAPGPSTIPEQVLLEMAKPIIHHRTKTFEKVLTKIKGQLKYVFQTQNDIILHASVGSGGMESALVNCFSPGDKLIAIRSGKFGERWSEIAKGYGLTVVDVDVPWGQAVSLAEFQKVLDKNPDARGVLCQACETSTGVSHPIHEMGKIIHDRPDTLFLVDAITALGISDIRTDEWHLDVVVSGSQKALMLPPGLSLLSFSQKAWNANEKARLPRYYFDVKKEREFLSKDQTHFTPAISLIQGLSVALDLMVQETLPKIFSRHQRLARATREAMKVMGLKLFSSAPSDSITAVEVPAGIDGEKVVKHMQEKYNMTIIGGQDRLKGKIFRLGHMGYCGDFDVISMISGTEMTLKDLGYGFELGVGVQTALKVIHHDFHH